MLKQQNMESTVNKYVHHFTFCLQQVPRSACAEHTKEEHFVWYAKGVSVYSAGHENVSHMAMLTSTTPAAPPGSAALDATCGAGVSALNTKPIIVVEVVVVDEELSTAAAACAAAAAAAAGVSCGCGGPVTEDGSAAFAFVTTDAVGDSCDGCEGGEGGEGCEGAGGEGGEDRLPPSPFAAAACGARSPSAAPAAAPWPGPGAFVHLIFSPKSL